METVYVIDALRTAIGRYGGALSSIRPDDLLADVIKALVKRNGRIDVNEIENIVAKISSQLVGIRLVVIRLIGIRLVAILGEVLRVADAQDV